MTPGSANPRTGDESSRSRAQIAALVGLVLGCCLVGSALAAPVAAGDNVAVFELEANATDVEPGESVAVTVTMESHGAYDDARVASVALRLDYPADYLTVTEVEAANWFASAPDSEDGTGPADPDVSTSTATNGSAGVTRHTQQLATPEEGTTGRARVATVTFTVSADASAATVVVDAAESEVGLTSRYPQPVSARPLALDVAGGGDRVAPDYPEEPFAPEGTAVEGTATEGESTAGESTTTGASSTPTDAATTRHGTTETASSDATPGFGVVAVLVAVAGLLRGSRLLFARRGD